MGLFERGEEARPLAERLRPRSFDELVGQEPLLAKGGWLAEMLAKGVLSSLVLYGPAGSGKTTLARLLAKAVDAEARQRNATTVTLPELRSLLEEGQKWQRLGKRFVLILDEIHRLNRIQQDALLPYLEEGSVILLGATTENPYYDLAPALRSRVRLVPLRPLSPEALRRLCRRALEDPRGLGGRHLRMDPDAEAWLIRYAEGDARRLLNLLEDASRGKGEGETIRLEDFAGGTLGTVYDERTEHYATISAFIKSIRGGDADSALVWLAKMLAGGESPRYIARRLVILASEDVGLADPAALPLAMAAADGVELVGLPEGALLLAHATIYLARAPKSRVVVDALYRAEALVREVGRLTVPAYLTNPTRAERQDRQLPAYRLPGAGGEGQSYWPEGVDRRPIVLPDAAAPEGQP